MKRISKVSRTLMAAGLGGTLACGLAGAVPPSHLQSAEAQQSYSLGVTDGTRTRIGRATTSCVAFTPRPQWSERDLNPASSGCEPDALPIELSPRTKNRNVQHRKHKSAHGKVVLAHWAIFCLCFLSCVFCVYANID